MKHSLISTFAAVTVIFASALSQHPANAAGADTEIYQVARSVGIETCLPRLHELANILGADLDAHNIWNTESTDMSIFSSFVSKEYEDGISHVLISTGLTADGNCYGEYKETLVSESSCEQIKEDMNMRLSRLGVLQGHTGGYRIDGSPMMLYFTPILDGSMCMATTRYSAPASR